MPKVIQVIESEVVRGTGTDAPLRGVSQYHTLTGDLLAENDPYPGHSATRDRLRGVLYRLSHWNEDEFGAIQNMKREAEEAFRNS